MNERQRRFCELYAASGNAAEAARLAGYSEKTARQQGHARLIKSGEWKARDRNPEEQKAYGT